MQRIKIWRTICLLIIVISCLRAQQITASFSATSVKQPGAAPITLTVGFQDAPTASNTATLSWNWSGNLTPTLALIPAPGTQGNAQNDNYKDLACSPTGCVLVGGGILPGAAGITVTPGKLVTVPEASPLGTGNFATFTIVPPTAAGTYSLSLMATKAGSATGALITVSAPPTLTLTVTAPITGDVNGDGVIDANDLTAELLTILVPSTCSATFDLDGDGLCTVADLQKIINVIPGATH